MRILKPYATDIERFEDTANIDSAIMAVTSLTTDAASESEEQKVVSEEVVSEEVVSGKVVSEEVVSEKVVSEKVVSEEIESEKSSMLFWYIVLGLIVAFVLFLISFIAFSEGSERINKSGNIEISESESD